MKQRPSPPEPPPLEAHLGFWLRFLSNHGSDRFRRLLEEQGVNVTKRVALRTPWVGAGTCHAGLKQLLQRAGCAGYTVWLAGRHLSDLGRSGETHVERTPD